MSDPAVGVTIGSTPVLVIGGSGFIGSHLVRRLVIDGARVHVLVRSGTETWRITDVLPDVTLWPGDVIDPSAVAACLSAARPEVVFYLAGDTNGRWVVPGPNQLDLGFEANFRGPLNVLKAVQATGVPLRAFIRAGGLAEYGNGNVPYDESQREAPASPYSAGQVAATHFCQMLNRAVGLPTITLRLALTYGPAQSDQFLIPSLIKHCLDGRPFDLTSGLQGRDLVYVVDVIEALVRAATTPSASGKVLNVGSGQEYRIRDVAETIVRLTGAPGDLLRVGAAPDRVADIEHQVCRNDKAAKLLSWVSSTALEVGLAQTIAWYRNRFVQKT